MRTSISPERLAERICRRFDLKACDNAEGLTELLREALLDVRETAIASTRAVCLEISQDKAEGCRRVGATAVQQTAMNIAARIRKRHVSPVNARNRLIRRARSATFSCFVVGRRPVGN